MPATRAVYTIPEVCTILACSRSTVYELIRRGDLISPVRGRVSIASLDRLLAEGSGWRARQTRKPPAPQTAANEPPRIKIPQGKPLKLEF